MGLFGSFIGFLRYYHSKAPQTPRQAPDALHEVQPEGGYTVSDK